MNNRRNFLKSVSLLGVAGCLPSCTLSGGGKQPANATGSSVNFKRNLMYTEGYDVVICGGGPSGTVAALSASREGLKVLLVESMGQLGGMAVSGHVSHWLGGRTEEGEWVVGGLFKSLTEEAAAKGYAVIPHLDPAKKYHPYGWFNWFIHGIPLDPFKVDMFLDEKMKQANVDVLLQTQFVDVLVERDKITHVVLYNPSGLFAVPAKAVIDATGNADVAARSGCKTVKGRPEDGKLTPSSLIFHAYNVDAEALIRSVEEHRDPKFRDLITKLREKGEWNFPYDIFICTQLIEKGEFYINTSRLTGIDGTDGKSVSEGLARGRQEVHELLALLRKYFPGFKDAKIKSIASQLGIRETRRIAGEFVMTVDDLKNGRDFSDCIGFSMYGWDLPDPDKPSVQPFAEDEKTGFKAKVEKKLSTPLPYRMMIPGPITNLICPGRAVSVEGQVLGPVRVMAPCMAMGEAAGVATWQVVQKDVPYATVDMSIVREKLISYGAIVDRDALPVIHPRVDQV